MKKISISSPSLGKEEEKAILEVIRSGQIAQGETVKLFEEKFAKYIGTKYAIATSNGTTALHLALLALNIKEGDEIITTPFSFIASSNCILYTGAKPVFADINPNTFNIDPKEIEKKITSKTKAILPVHLFGLPADMEEINKIAAKHGLAVIEDACQAHGAEIAGKKVGAWGTVACFSFYPTKNMTTGEGGMIITNDPNIADQARLLRNHGMPIRYHHDLLGYNFRLTNIAAAIGLEQLKKLPSFNKARAQNARYLNKYLSKIPGIEIPQIPSSYKHVFHQYTIKITNDYGIKRDELKQRLDNLGIGNMIYYPIPIHQQKIYTDLGFKEKFPVTEEITTQVISLPIHPQLKKHDLSTIVKAFKG